MTRKPKLSPVRIDGGDGDSQKIPCWKKVVFSAPVVALLPFQMMFGMYGIMYYQKFGASLAMVALFTALSRSFDVISDPVMSYLTDSSLQWGWPFTEHGRRRPFLLVGCVVYAIFLKLLLRPPYVGRLGLSLWFGLFYTTYFLANTLLGIPYYAFAAELSEDSTERTQLFFTMTTFEAVGTVMAMGLPTIASMSVQRREANAFICKTVVQQSQLCLMGRSCSGFQWRGEEALREPDIALETLLANLTDLVPTDLQQAPDNCIAWDMESSNSVLGPAATYAQNNAFCKCLNGCSDACFLANTHVSFSSLGTIFACWSLASVMLLVWLVKERKPDGVARPQAPIVPTFRRTMCNGPFVVLMPAWVCDAFCSALFGSISYYYVEAVVAPEQQTMEEHGRDCAASSPLYDGGRWRGLAGQRDHPSFDWMCDTSSVMALTGICVIGAAILSLPFWKCCASTFGKVNTWLLWSVTKAVSTLFFLFLGTGQLYALWIIAALNGVPESAKFLADSILADIIDYDEFLTGTRSEATYFMYKNFLPKVVQIPTSAIPLALLGVFGYISPVAGESARQPRSVCLYLKGLLALTAGLSLLAYVLKRRYKLRGDEIKALNEGLRAHKAGREAPDPLSGKPYHPLVAKSTEEEKVFNLLGHFTTDQLNGYFHDEGYLGVDVLAGTQSLSAMAKRYRALAVVGLVFAILGTAATFALISDTTWQFVPTLFVVAIGMMVTCTCFFVAIAGAARKLMELAEKDELSPYSIARFTTQRNTFDHLIEENNRFCEVESTETSSSEEDQDASNPASVDSD